MTGSRRVGAGWRPAGAAAGAVAFAAILASLLPGAVAAGTALESAEAEFAAGRYERAAELFETHLAAAPSDGDARVRLGWSRYRAGQAARAREAFAAALARDPHRDDARTGLGYALLQAAGPAAAAPEFRQVLRHRPNDHDALHGLVLVARRSPADAVLVAEGIAAAERLIRLDPADREATTALAALHAARGGHYEKRLRPDADRSAPLVVAARAGKDYLELPDGRGGWQPVFIKGFNLGTALPGRFPTGFPEDDETYRRWLETMADLGANTVRLYTLLPPAFYRALAAHNAAPDARRLHLIQGVWTELPPGHDFSNPGYVEEFQAEIARVIDAVHGNLLLAPRPGHASGLYDTDASASLLAYIIGREWEPFAVKDYNALRQEQTSCQGKWFRVEEGRAMECWVARMCDFAAGYEAKTYRTIHPLTFANWPTLDPLDHPTESTRAEEDAWKRRFGIEHPERLREAPWEDDAVSLDATLIRPTEAMAAGFFAAYHIYPNFPDFLNLQDSYGSARDEAGPSRYAGYLRELKAYHGDQPVVVAEFGISTSRGIAHLQPQGWHHGGLDEASQGEIVARMLRQIHDSRYAGGIVFSFMDEWFKGTWSVAPFEIPAERRRLWFNAESPEQSYGILAARPGPAGGGIVVDGDPADWEGIAPLASASGGDPAAARTRGAGWWKGGAAPDGWRSLREIRASSDEGYLYLLVRTAGGPAPPDWKRVMYRVALDTYDPERGERSLPGPGRARAPSGVEFLVDLLGPGKSAVTVSAPYEPYAHLDAGPFASPERPTGAFARLAFETNRERIGRDGTRFPAERVDRGRLRFAENGSRQAGVHDDVAVGAATGTIELRLPWSLLNVTDPSSRRVLHQDAPGGDPYGTVETDGFRIYVFTADPSRPRGAALDRLPAGDGPAVPFRWREWEDPVYHLELKRGAGRIRDEMRRLPDAIERETAAAPRDAGADAGRASGSKEEARDGF